MPAKKIGAACLLLAAPLAALLVVLGSPEPPTPVPGPTLENFNRLHVGMAQSEAKAILGPPAESGKNFVAWECSRCSIWLGWDGEARIEEGSCWTTYGSTYILHSLDPEPSPWYVRLWEWTLKPFRS